MTSAMGNIGKSVLRKEGRPKLTGHAQYIDDITMPEMIYGATIRSSVPRATIKNIYFEGDIPWDEFTIVSAKDIPGKNVVMVLIDDQPILADGVINHAEEPVVLLAHPDKYLLEQAKQHVRIEVVELPALFTLEESAAKKEIIWGEDNTFKTFTIKKGDVSSVWDNAAHVVEGKYRTGAQEQLYIENNGMIAVANKKDGVTIWGSMQCPYYIHKALLPIFDLPEDKIRIIQSTTGGGFGGKEEYPSIIAAHAALLALKSGKPVKMIYDRAEDMVATTKRHPSLTRVKTAHDADGTLLAIDVDFILDGGAYCTLSPVVLSRGTIHAAGPYKCDNVYISSRVVATNLPPQGAFRGFSAPQSIFAIERHLDRAASEIGITPEQIRRKNFLKPGDTTATQQEIKEHVDYDALTDFAFKKTDYHNKLKEFAAFNAANPRIKKGIGFATFMHGSGFTGSGERYLASVTSADVTAEGGVRLFTSSTEIGQGKDTVFTQIAADTLGISMDLIEIVQPDTAKVPNSGPTVASRTTMVVGKLVEVACENLKQALLKSGHLAEGYAAKDWAPACAAYLAEHDALKVFSEYKQPSGVFWDDEKYEGEAYATYAWANYVAEVTIDLDTFETKIDDFVAVQEIGRVINPVLAKGQIEGGIAQAIGYAVYEKVVWQDGKMVNNQMTNYIMPTAADVPPIRVFFKEDNLEHGPSGAKGIGELPMDGPAPAILNAISHAVGRQVDEAPMLPEDLMKVMQRP